MMNRTLFDSLDDDFELCDPCVPDAARPRLSRQCRDILARLREGPALNTELAAVALKYTGRISDLRRNGYRIECTTVDSRAGIFRYRLAT